MELYVVRPGDSIYSIATQFSLPMAQIIWDNGLTDPGELVVGQVLVLRFPNKTYVVRPGDTLAQIASNNQTSVRQLLRNNPFLSGSNQIQPGQRLVLSYDQSPLFPPKRSDRCIVRPKRRNWPPNQRTFEVLPSLPRSAKPTISDRG